MAEAGRDEEALYNNCSPGVHIFDFKYSTETTAEELRYLITEQVVRYLGNPACIEKTYQHNDEKNKSEEKNTPQTNHRVLDIKQGNEHVCQSVMNKSYICLLLNNGNVLRASCKVSKIDSNNDQQTRPVTSDERPIQQIPFQVASDESYARHLQRNINTLNIANRRSYLSRSPMQTFNNTSSSATSPHNRRELLHASFILNPAIHRLSPTLRAHRYLPYDRDSRPNRRHIQMGHLLNTSPLTTRALMYATTADMASPIDMPESAQIGLLDSNITIVSLDNQLEEGTANDTEINNYTSAAANGPDILPSLPINDDGISHQDSSFTEQPEPFFNDDNERNMTVLASNELPFHVPTIETSLDSNSNDSMKFSVNNLLDDTQDKPGPSTHRHMASSSQESMARTSSVNTNAPIKSKIDVENGRSSSPNRSSNWIPEFDDFVESSHNGDVIVVSIYAMESAIYLLDNHGVLWVWHNMESHPQKAMFPWNGHEKITHMGCNLFRATVFFQSKCCSTFYDKCFADKNGGEEPTLIKTLSHPPTSFVNICDEEIIDVQCSTFFTVIHTLTESSFWWGLAPSSERNTPISSAPAKTKDNTEIQIGDNVSLSKQDKNESGALVFNNILGQFGVVLGKMYNDVNTNSLHNKIDVRCLQDTCALDAMIPFNQVWDCKDIVFLQEQSSFIGKVVSLDGPYAIVQHNETSGMDQENLKVYFKTALEKIGNEQDVKIGRNRYQKYLSLEPLEVFPDENFTITALSATELGINLLVRRKTDDKAFLVYPPCLNNHYSSWFTCSKPQLSANENLISESNRTVEYEAVPAPESNLNVVTKECPSNIFNNQPPLSNVTYEDTFYISESVEDVLGSACSLNELNRILLNTCKQTKFSRSISMPVGQISDEKHLKRKLTGSVARETNNALQIWKPKLISTGNTTNQMSLLLDNKSCFYPLRFNCCLINPPFLEILPVKTFVLFDHGLALSRGERLLTLIAIPKPAPLTLTIRNGDREALENLIGSSSSSTECSQTDSPKKKMKFDKVGISEAVTTNQHLKLLNDLFAEVSSGNQNVMHIAVSNILKTHTKSPLHSNLMEARNEEENAVLQQLLENTKIWPKIKQLLCKRDSHGCTPFMSAIIMQNLRGAYLILEAVKRNGRNEVKVSVPTDKKLFQEAICTPTFSGLTPLHALIHSSSKKQSSQQWYNTLKISNLPQSYSARLLLKLFKVQYPSVYRAIMPVPKPMWPQRTVRDRSKGESRGVAYVNNKRGKLKLNVNTAQRPPAYVDLSSRAGIPVAGGRYTLNRADIIRANAKEGLVMFGDINEMYQALQEMNNYSLLTKNDHPSGALLSVVQHLLHVQQYQELQSDPYDASQMINRNLSSSSAVSSASTSSSANSASLDLYPTVSRQFGSTPAETSTNSRDDTISKCFDDIMVHLLITSLVNADPLLAASANPEGDSALCYFIRTYPRYSPSHLHKLYLNWRPCNRKNCKYNRHVGKLSITCQNEIEQSQTNQDRKKHLKEDQTKPQASKPSSSGSENPILARRGLQYRGNSLMLNVKKKPGYNDTGSPITPNIRILDNIKFAPIEIAATTGLTPQIAHPYSAADNMKNEGQSSSRKQLGFSPFFPQVITSETPIPLIHEPEADVCNCHLTKPRLLWNTTFEASVFYLAKSWPCVIGTVMLYKPFRKDVPNVNPFKTVDSNQLDTFTENLLHNPYNILLEVFIKTLMLKFSQSKLSKNVALLSEVHHHNPLDQDVFKGKTLFGLLPWLTMHRFVRSLVRQLSLCLSKNATSDGNLKYKIGRFANKNHAKKEARSKENLSLCLKAFSWISVLEILRAADTMLKPIRSGTVKAQAKGIIRDIHNSGNPLDRSSLPTGIRMHIPSSGLNMGQRSFIRNASRRPMNIPACIPLAANSMLKNNGEESSSSYHAQDEDSNSDNDDSSHLDDPYMTETSNSIDRNVMDINTTDWNQNQGITPNSSVAWAVDGHIRVRSEVSNRLLPPPGLWQFNQPNQLQQQIMNTPSIHAGYLYLARMFCRLVKEAVDIAKSLRHNKGLEYGPSNGPFLVQPLQFDKNVEEMFIRDSQLILENSWKWMKNILDSLEQQLKVGEDFDTKHYVLRLKKNGPDGDITGLGRPSTVHKYGSTPDEYMIYLLKQGMGEAENSLPVLDLFSYTHMTYVLDAYLYMNKTNPFDMLEQEHQQKEDSMEKSTNDCANQAFFKDAIDLSTPVTVEKIESFRVHVEGIKAVSNHISTWLDESVAKRSNNSEEVKNPSHWNRVVDAFSALFLTEGPGYERDSFLAAKAGASGRISRFKRSLSTIRGVDPSSRPYSISTSQPEYQALLMNVVRSKLMEDCIAIFSEKMDNHPFGSLRVRFEGEEGTGPGVNRGLFAAFATALKTGEKYKHWPVEFFSQCGNLPSQRGIFSPKAGKFHHAEQPTVYFGYPMTKEKRYEAFVAIGRFLGLTLWFNQSVPFIMSRPVLIYLLGREEQLTFDDLAYFDSALYQSFSNLMMDALSSTYTNKEFVNLYCLNFEITVDGHTEELFPGGQQMQVNKHSVLNYIRLYTRHLLITARENELQGLRDGLQHMIPKELLDNLEPEDLQLLLSGGGEDVSYARLKSIISFSNSRGCSREVLERYKTWFWKIVLKMSSIERQKLLYFATGSSVLPALDNRVGNNEELSITVDIINSTNNSALPMSSTCGQRISMPLYTSKAMLKQKLLQAIECQSYGLG